MDKRTILWRISHGLKWENKLSKLKRSIGRLDNTFHRINLRYAGLWICCHLSRIAIGLLHSVIHPLNKQGFPLSCILAAHFIFTIFQPPRNYQPAVTSEPSKPKAPPPRPPPPAPPAPPVEKTVSCFAAF